MGTQDVQRCHLLFLLPKYVCLLTRKWVETCVIGADSDGAVSGTIHVCVPGVQRDAGQGRYGSGNSYPTTGGAGTNRFAIHPPVSVLLSSLMMISSEDVRSKQSPFPEKLTDCFDAKRTRLSGPPAAPVRSRSMRGELPFVVRHELPCSFPGCDGAREDVLACP